MTGDLVFDVASWLATRLGLVMGGDLFGSVLPDTPDTCVALFETQGIGPRHTFGTGVLLEAARLQVFTRAPSYPDAIALARDVYTALMSLSSVTIGNTVYAGADPLSTPALMEVDARDRHVIVCNFDVWRQP